MSLREWIMLLALGCVWGGSFFFAKVAVAEIHPLLLVLLRVGIAAAALHVWLAIVGPSLRAILPRWKSIAVLGLINNVVPFSLIFIGQTELGAGLASVLNATTPFWTVLFANAVTTDERLTLNKIAGILLGISGAAVMIGPGLVAGLGGPVWAKLVLIGAAVSYALAAIWSKRFSDLAPVTVATGQLTASTIIMIPLVTLAVGVPDVGSVSLTAWACVAALALVSTAYAYILYFGIVRSAGATNASLVTMIVPATAILLGATLLGKQLESFELFGIALIATGLVTIDGRLLRRR